MDLVLDEHILIDHIGKREPFYEAARRICILGITQKVDLYVGTTAMTDIFYLLQKDFGAQKASEMIESSLSFLRPVGVSPEDTTRALTQAWDDLEKCLLAQCAEKIRANYIITRSPEEFQRSKVPAITPAQLLEIVEEPA